MVSLYSMLGFIVQYATSSPQLSLPILKLSILSVKWIKSILTEMQVTFWKYSAIYELKIFFFNRVQMLIFPLPLKTTVTFLVL